MTKRGLLMTTYLSLHVHVGIECPQRKWVCIFLANGKKIWQGGSSETWLLMFFRGDVRLEPDIFYLSITNPARVQVTLKKLLAYYKINTHTYSEQEIFDARNLWKYKNISNITYEFSISILFIIWVSFIGGSQTKIT